MSAQAGHWARRWTGQRGPDLLGHVTTHAHLCLPFSKGQLPCALFSLHLAAPWAGSVLKAVSCHLFTAVCGPCYTLAPRRPQRALLSQWKTLSKESPQSLNLRATW